MGCSSSVPVQPQAQQNGHVVKASPPRTPPERQQEQHQQQHNQQVQPQVQPQEPERQRRKSSPSGKKSPSSSSSSSRSSSAKSKNNRPVTAPGGEPEVGVAEDKPKVTGEVVQDQPEEPTNEAPSEKPNFDEDALKHFVEIENRIREIENKDATNVYKSKHGRLVELYKNLGESKKKVDELRKQT